MRFRISDSRVAMSDERHEHKSAMDANVPRASFWMLLINLCLVIFDAVFVVDADYCSCKGQDLAKGGEDCRVDDSHRWNEKGGCDEEDTEANEQKGKKNLMLHLDVKVLRRFAC